MKILIASSVSLPQKGGAEFMLDYLFEIFGKDNELIKVLPYYSIYDDSKSFKVYWFMNSPFFFLTPFKLLYYCLKYKIQIINVHMAIPTTLHFVLCKLTGIPIVITTHGGDIQTDMKLKYGLTNIYRRIAFVFAYRMANRVIIGDESIKKDLTGFPINFSKLEIIPPFVKLPKIKSNIINKKIEKKEINIVFFSRFHPKKGLDDLLVVWKELSDYSNAKLFIIGDDDINPYLELLNEQKNLEVLKLGREEAISFMAECDIFCVPSKKESFGLVFQEAFNSGLPIVAYDIPPVNKIVKHNFNGLLAQKGNKLELKNYLEGFLSNPNLINLFKNNVKEKKFNKKSIKNYIILFNNIALKQNNHH